MRRYHHIMLFFPSFITHPLRGRVWSWTSVSRLQTGGWWVDGEGLFIQCAAAFRYLHCRKFRCGPENDEFGRRGVCGKGRSMHPGGGETIQRRRRLPAHVYTTMDGGGARGPEYKIYHRSHARGKPDQVQCRLARDDRAAPLGRRSVTNPSADKTGRFVKYVRSSQ